MTATIELVITRRPLERTEGDIAVVGFFADERPLRGGAARADWRLCGGLSKRIMNDDLSGKNGDALLIGCGRALAAPRLLLLGLGDRQRFDRVRVCDETREAMTRVLKLGCTRVAFTPLGIGSDDIPRHADALIAGIRDAWDGAAQPPLNVNLCVRRSEIPAVLRALQAARDAANAASIVISVRETDHERR